MDEKSIVYIIALTSFFTTLALCAIVAFMIFMFQKRKYLLAKAKSDAIIREKELLLEKQQELQNERNRIASDMHDDIGFRLTTINYLVNMLKDPVDDSEKGQMIQKIDKNTSDLISTLSEIVWAMNNRYDTVQNLIDFARRIIVGCLEEINYKYKIASQILNPDTEISGAKRRALIMCIKETINNSIKYSGASLIEMGFVANSENQLEINIVEHDGVGFVPDECTKIGNGLYNIQKRISELKGTVEYKKMPGMMTISFKIPLI
jgi:signal transduction histidine kinase